MTIIVFCLGACDCGQIVKGVVIDSYNRQPIQGVEIEKTYRNDRSKYPKNRQLSDSSGSFAVNYIAGGVLCYCPDFQLSFSKLDYVTQKKIYNGIVLRDTIYLEKVK